MTIPEILALDALALKKLIYTPLAHTFNWFFDFGWILSFALGLVIWLWFSISDPKRKKMILSLIVILVILGPLQAYLIGPIAKWGLSWNPRVDPYIEWIATLEKHGLHGLCVVLGLLTGFFCTRYLIPAVSAYLSRFTRNNQQLRDTRTDIRTVATMLPRATAYDPTKKFKQGTVFLGVDERGKNVTIPYDLFKTVHVDCVGTTGGGKGIATSLLLTQAAEHGEAVFVLDPKNDEWAPHVLRAQANKLGIPFHLVDLRGELHFCQLTANSTALEIEELLFAGFGLSERGDTADFYRISDRKAARDIAKLLADGYSWKQVLSSPDFHAWREDAPAFCDNFLELAPIVSLFGIGTESLEAVIEAGGIVYFIGSMRNQAVITAQRMITVKIIQLCERRDRVKAQRPVCLFLDELKYHISKPTMEALGAARDKGLHVLMAHQSIDDLHDCPADLSPLAVVGSVVENCKIKIFYRVGSPDTAKWMAAMTGKIQVDDETRHVDRNTGLAETVSSSKTVRQSERFLIDENMFLALPDRVAVVLTPGEVSRPATIQPLQVEKSALQMSGQQMTEGSESKFHVPVSAKRRNTTKKRPPNHSSAQAPEHYQKPNEFDPFDPTNWEER